MPFMAMFVLFVLYPAMVGMLSIPLALIMKRAPRGSMITLVFFLSVVVIGAATIGYVSGSSG